MIHSRLHFRREVEAPHGAAFLEEPRLIRCSRMLACTLTKPSVRPQSLGKATVALAPTACLSRELLWPVSTSSAVVLDGFHAVPLRKACAAAREQDEDG